MTRPRAGPITCWNPSRQRTRWRVPDFENFIVGCSSTFHYLNDLEDFIFFDSWYLLALLIIRAFFMQLSVTYQTGNDTYNGKHLIASPKYHHTNNHAALLCTYYIFHSIPCNIYLTSFKTKHVCTCVCRHSVKLQNTCLHLAKDPTRQYCVSKSWHRTRSPHKLHKSVLTTLSPTFLPSASNDLTPKKCERCGFCLTHMLTKLQILKSNYCCDFLGRK